MATYYTIQTWIGGMLDSETFNLYETFDEACDTIEGYMKAYVDFEESYLEKIKPNREEKRKNIESWNRVAYLKMPSGDMKYITKLTVVPNKKETIREIPNLTEIARLLQGDMYKFKKVSVVEEAENCSYNVKYYPQDDDTLAYFLSLILAEHRNQHVLLHLHKLADTNRYMIYMAVRDMPKKYVYQYYVRNDEQTEMKASPKYETFDEICDVLDKKLRELHGEDWQPRMTRDEYKKYMDDHTACAISYDFFKTDTYVLFWTEVEETPKKYMAVRNTETSADEEDKYLEANFEEVFKRSREVKYLNGRPVRNTWYDPVKKWAYQVYFSEGEKPQTFYDLESRNIKTIDFFKTDSNVLFRQEA
jgi:hypothetical protein